MNSVRFLALMHKELGQVRADKSIFVIAFILPIVLLIIYGFGINMDIKSVGVAISVKDNSTLVREMKNAFVGSDYFVPYNVFSDKKAMEMLQDGTVMAAILIPDNLQREIGQGRGSILINVNGSESQNAQITLTYILTTLQSVFENHQIEVNKGLTLEVRNWFNEDNESVKFLVPGQMIGIVTLICCFMSSIVVAREYDRHTIQGLMATNVNALEFLLSKFCIYYALSLLGAIVCFAFSFLCFDLELKGSAIALITLIVIYNFNAIFMGLLISAIVKSQFLGSMMSVIFSFLPSILLSGVVFDLRSVPYAINVIGHIFPATYAVQSIRICFMSGGNLDILFFDFFYIFVTGCAFMGLSLKIVKKSLR